MSIDSRSKKFAYAVIALLAAVIASELLIYSVISSGTAPLKKKIAVINIDGIIEDPQETLEQLKKYGDDKSVRAVLIRLNTPGGAAAPVQEIYDEILHIKKKTGKVFVASMGGVAASGGYYIACAADKIFANPGTVTGSIGVVMQFLNTEALVKKIGVGVEVIKKGEYKDIGSSNRKITDSERKILDELVTEVFSQFLGAVKTGRKLDDRDLDNLADGRILTGSQAKKAGLVDSTGGYLPALREAARMAGIEGEPKVIKEKPSPRYFSMMLNAITPLEKNMVSAGPKFKLSFIME